MKTIIFILLMISINASAMTCEEAKTVIAEFKAKQNKKKTDYESMREAVSKIGACSLKPND